MREKNSFPGGNRPEGIRRKAVSLLPAVAGILVLAFAGAPLRADQTPDMKDIVELKQSHLTDLLQRAQEAVAAGRNREALIYYDRVLRLDAANARALKGRVQLVAAENFNAVRSEAGQTVTVAQAGATAQAGAAKANAAAEKDKQARIKTLLDQGNQGLKKGDLTAARTAFEEVLKLDEQNKKALSGLDSVREAETKAAQKAKEAEAQRIRDEQQKVVDERVKSAGLLYKEKKYEDALRLFSSALEVIPTDKAALKGKKAAETALDKQRKAAEDKAREEVEMKQREEAKRAQEEQERKKAEAGRQEEEIQKQADAYMKAAKQLYKEEKYEAAIGQYNLALEKMPGYKAAVDGKEKAQTALEKQRLAAQEKAREEAVRKQKEEEARRLAEAKQAEAMKKEQDAQAKKAAAAKAEQERQEAERKQKEEARLAGEEQQKKEAEEAKQRAEIQGQADAYVKAAKQLYKEEKYEAAIDQYNLALEKLPEYKAAADGRGKAQAALEKQRLAAAAQQKAREEAASKQKAEEERQRTEAERAEAQKRGQAAQAEKAAEMKAEQERQEAASNKQKAEGELQRAEAERAEAQKRERAAQEKQAAEAAKAEEERVNEAKELASRGDSAFQRKRYVDALNYYERAAAITPGDAALKDKIEQAKAAEKERLAQEEKQAEAKRQAEKAEALLSKAKTATKSGKYDEALAALKEAQELSPGNAAIQKQVEATTALKTKAEAAESKRQEEQAAKEEAGRKRKEAEARRAETQAHLKSGQALMDKKEYDKAIEEFKAVLKDNPDEPSAKDLARRCEEAIEQTRQQATAQAALEKRDEAKRVFQDALEAYKKGDLIAAAEGWERTLAIDPEFERAKTYLEETKQAVEAKKAELLASEQREAQEREASAKLNLKISIEVQEPTPLVEFLNSLALYADFNYNVVAGGNVMVQGKFDDLRLKDILDRVLPSRGLKWSRELNVITVEPDLVARVFSLSDTEIVKVRGLLADKTLQRTLWGGEKPPVPDASLRLDERAGQMIVNLARVDIDRLEVFLRELKEAPGVAYEMRIYKVREEDGPKIKTLLSSVLEAEGKEEGGRKIILDGTDLIVKDTPENLRLAEKILMDQNFIENLRNENLAIETWNLTPREVSEGESREALDYYLERAVEAIRVMLYSRTGEAEAAKRGRMLWFNKELGTLTITDTEENIRKISEFIDKLDILQRKERSKLIFLKFANSSELITDLQAALGITVQGAAGAAAGGEVATRTLTRGNSTTWKNLTLRLTRVEQNDLARDDDDTIQVDLITPLERNQNVSIEVYRSEYVRDEGGEYEINVLDVSPSGNGNGSCRVELRYRPTLAAVTAPTAEGAPTPEEQAAAEVATEEMPINFTEFTKFNALLIRYRDPGLFAEVMEWIDKLDRPTLQVSIETRFVEVNEARAREFSSEFSIDNLGDRSLRLFDSHSTFNTDFAAVDNPFRPSNMDLLQGVTRIDAFIPGQDQKNFKGLPIDWNLRILEAEGVISVVNGPTVTVLNQESARFEIVRWFNYNQLLTGQTNVTGRNQNQNQLPQVDFSVTPDQITERGAISLTLTIELNDMVDITDRRQKRLTTVARLQDNETIVLGGWTNERGEELTSGFPILRNLPYVGKLFFGRNQSTLERSTLVVFLTAHILR